MEIETLNQFAVGTGGDGVIVLRPPYGPLSKDKALNLAAYLVVLSGASPEEFDAVRTAIENA